MAESPEPTPDATIACPMCGTKNASSNMRCKLCDTRLGDAKEAAIPSLRLRAEAQSQEPISYEEPSISFKKLTMAHAELPASIEPQVLATLERIESRAKQNQRFLVMTLILLFLVLVALMFF